MLGILACIIVDKVRNIISDLQRRNPAITRSRMYYEAIQTVLPGVKLYINTSTGGQVQMLLPLESMIDVPAGEGGGD